MSMSWLTVVAHNRFSAPARLDRSILRESFVKALGSFWGNRRYSVSIAAIDPQRVVSAFGVRGILRHLPASAGRQAVASGRCLYSAASHAPAINALRGSCCMSSKRRRDGCAGEVRGRSLCTAVARPRFLQHTRSGAFVSPSRLSAAPSNLTCSRANPCLPCIRSSKSPSRRVPADRRSASGAARRRPGLAECVTACPDRHPSCLFCLRSLRSSLRSLWRARLRALSAPGLPAATFASRRQVPRPGIFGRQRAPTPTH